MVICDADAVNERRSGASHAARFFGTRTRRAAKRTKDMAMDLRTRLQ